MNLKEKNGIEYPLETVQGPWWGHTGHAGPIDGTELNLIESDGGGLQTSLHDFQWTSQYGSYRAPTSDITTEWVKVRVRQQAISGSELMAQD